MKAPRRVVMIAFAAMLLGAGISEWLVRWETVRGVRRGEAGRRLVARQADRLTSSQRRLIEALTRERARGQELAVELTMARLQEKAARAEASEERRATQLLQERLAVMQGRMEQLQGELALAVEDRLTSRLEAPPSSVELERVIVTPTGSPGLEGRVVSVSPEWDFVVVDLGWDAVKAGDTISILRGGARLAEAHIERVQEDVAAATVLPGWQTAAIEVNDRVQGY